MNDFKNDLLFSEKQRNRLKNFYSMKAVDGRFVFINKNSGEISTKLQNIAVDTILQISDDKEIYIEEKIVRWPGYKYANFTLETDSCTIKGREKTGWMEYAKCDFILYGFTQEDNKIEGYLIPFKKLKEWFWKNYEKYPVTITNQLNKTKCRIVPIKDIELNVGYEKLFIGSI